MTTKAKTEFLNWYIRQSAYIWLAVERPCCNTRMLTFCHHKIFKNCEHQRKGKLCTLTYRDSQSSEEISDFYAPHLYRVSVQHLLYIPKLSAGKRKTYFLFVEGGEGELYRQTKGKKEKKTEGIATHNNAKRLWIKRSLEKMRKNICFWRYER
jgi:hypothetical protein